MLTDKLHGRRNVSREQPKRIHKLFHLVCCVLTFILSNKWLQHILLIAFETKSIFFAKKYLYTAICRKSVELPTLAVGKKYMKYVFGQKIYNNNKQQN